MTTNKIIKLTAVFIGLGLNSIALANSEIESQQSYGYIQLNGGPALLKSGAGMFGNKSQGHTSIYGAEFGYKFDDYTRASISADYMPNHSFTNSTDNQSQIFSGRLLNVSNEVNFKINSRILMLNAYYDISNSSNFSPYITFGIGAAQNKAKATSTISNNGMKEPPLYYASSTKINFAYKFGFGARYAFNNRFDSDLRYQFVDLGKFTTSKASNPYGDNNFSSETSKLKIQEVLVGIAYKF